MSWLSDAFYEICISVVLCSAPVAATNPLPPTDKGVWAYNAPKEVPPPPPVQQIIVQAPPAPPVQQIIVNTPPPAPKVEPEPKPKPHPAIVANAKLLELRRLAALDIGLQHQIVESDLQKSDQPNISNMLTTLSSKSSPLEEEPTKGQDRYDAPSKESSLPVHNRRVVTEDEPIMVVLENAINSQIAGKVVLVVEKDIYGSDISTILIPKFSRVICNYEGTNSANATRMNMGCNRIIAAGKKFEILGISAEVGSPQGQAGVTGGVDNRFYEKYGTAFLLTGISTAVKVATGTIKSNSENQNAVTAVKDGAEELSQKFGEITAKVLEETVNLNSIITMSQGTRLRLSLGNDWYIKELPK